MSEQPATAEYIDDEWITQAPKGLRVPAVIGVLLLALVAVCGFWGGAVLQKHHDKKTATTTATAAVSGAVARRAAAGGFGGAGGAGGAAGGSGGAAAAGRTTGTVSDVEGTTVYVTDASGAIVKVNLAPATKITKASPATAADIQLGQTVVVTGAKASDGSTTAATLTLATTPAATPAAPGAATTPGG